MLLNQGFQAGLTVNTERGAFLQVFTTRFTSLFIFYAVADPGFPSRGERRQPLTVGHANLLFGQFFPNISPKIRPKVESRVIRFRITQNSEN